MDVGSVIIMKNIIKNNILFIGILVVYFFLSISLAGYYDYSGDSSIYSVRAFGWTDYIGDGQKGPVEWLGYKPWWGSLSFQDAPPVAFLLQNIFFRFLGDDISSVQTMFILLGCIQLGFIYFCIKKIRDKETAIWSTITYSVSSLALWSTFSGNLESILSLFVVLNFLSVSLYYRYKKDSLFYISVVFMGLALMTKYTAIFIIPSFFMSLYLYRKNEKSNFLENYRKYLLAIVIFLVIISPTVIYNYNIYLNRGNFDTALSAMVGMDNELGRGVNFNFVLNIFEVASTLFETSSFLYMVLCLLSFVFMTVRSQKKKTDIFEDTIVVYIFMLFVMLGFMGGGVRWIPIFIPLFAVVVGLFIMEYKKRTTNVTFVVIVSLALIFEFIYTINTNILLEPIGKVGIFSSRVRNQNVGFNQLDIYLKKELSPFPEKFKVEQPKDLEISYENVVNSTHKIIMYDGRINWFAKKWYLEKYFVYYRIGVFSYENSVVRNSIIPKNSIQTSDLEGSNKTLYFIEAVSPNVMNIDNPSVLVDRMEGFINNLKQVNVPFVDIIDKQGRVAFRVYKIQF